MDQRWKVLAAIALAIVVSDHATKYLAVAHLTPGIASAAKGERVVSRAELSETLQSTPLTAKLGLYFGEVRNPCRGSRRLCPEIKVFDGFWSWRYAENKGAAWSMFAQLGDGLRLPFLIGVSALAVVFIIGFIRKLEPGQPLLLTAFSLVLGGAFGNLIDRAVFGYVVDFILWYYDGHYWPTFNVADVAISVGVGLILLSSVLEFFEKRGASPSEPGVAPQ